MLRLLSRPSLRSTQFVIRFLQRIGSLEPCLCIYSLFLFGHSIVNISVLDFSFAELTLPPPNCH